MSLKEHFKKWDMKLKGWIWVSKHILKKSDMKLKEWIWVSQNILKMGYETQRMDLSLKEHF